MALNRDHYDDCLGCDGIVFLNDTDSFLNVIEEQNVDGCDVMVVVARIHPHCRAEYEENNGAIVCEGDEDRYADECERRGLFDAENHGTPFLPEPDPDTIERVQTAGKMLDLMEAFADALHEPAPVAAARRFVASAKERRREQ